MCEPVTLSLAIAATAVSTYTAVQGQMAANAQASAASKVAKMNAAEAELAAKEAERSGTLEASQHLTSVRGMAGQQRALFAAAGVDVLAGSAAGLFAETETLGFQDALTIQYNAALAARGLRTQALSYRTQAQIERSKMGSVGLAGLGPLLSGTASTAGIYGQYRHMDRMEAAAAKP